MEKTNPNLKVGFFLVFFSLAFYSFDLCAKPVVYEVKSENDFNISFQAKIKPVGGFEGKANKISGSITVDSDSKEVLSGSLIVPIEAITTNNNTRDKHMKEKYLETKKGFKDITLTLTKQKYVLDSKGQTKIKANWTIHGVTKEQTLTFNNTKFSVEKGHKILSFTSNFDLNITDFKIKKPSYLVVWMHPVLAMTIKLKVTENQIKPKKGK